MAMKPPTRTTSESMLEPSAPTIPVLNHPTRLRHLALHLVPELLELGDRGELLGLREGREELVAAGELRADHRLEDDARDVAGDLAHHAEELAEAAEPVVEHRLELVRPKLVLIVLRGERLAPCLGGVALRPRLGDELRLLVAAGEELALARRVRLRLDRAG